MQHSIFFLVAQEWCMSPVSSSCHHLLPTHCLFQTHHFPRHLLLLCLGGSSSIPRANYCFSFKSFLQAHLCLEAVKNLTVTWLMRTQPSMQINSPSVLSQHLSLVDSSVISCFVLQLGETLPFRVATALTYSRTGLGYTDTNWHEQQEIILALFVHCLSRK